jgi:hypothetical protein
MALHPTTFEYLKPTEAQLSTMSATRTIFADAALKLGELLPDGPDKTYVLRQFRDCAMWANIAIIRNPDGTPRQ